MPDTTRLLQLLESGATVRFQQDWEADVLGLTGAPAPHPFSVTCDCVHCEATWERVTVREGFRR